MNPLSMLAAFYREGGPFMHFILATGVVIIAIAVERFIVLSKAAGIDGKRLANDIAAAIQKGDLNNARRISQTSSAPAAQVAQAMLLSGGDESRVQAAADDAATLALPSLSRRLPHLAVLANVATLLGLLGTIQGLMQAFAAVGAADPSQRSAFLASGIATALNTTAFGLVIAVPTLLVHGWLVSMVESVVEQVDEVAVRVGRALSAVANSAAARPAAPAQGQVVAMPPRAVTPLAQPAPARGPLASQGGAQ